MDQLQEQRKLRQGEGNVSGCCLQCQLPDFFGKRVPCMIEYDPQGKKEGK